jgi:SAM-dependent methyltransferase
MGFGGSETALEVETRPSFSFRNALDSLAWARLGRPGRGKVEFLERNTYELEEGAEFLDRVQRRFGDLRHLRVADLGSGGGSSYIARQVLRAPWRKLVSVEAFPPYVQEISTKRAQAHERQIVEGLIQKVVRSFQPGEFDLFLLIDVLEHFPRAAALNLLVRLERLATTGIVIFIPLGRVITGAVDGNPLQRHRSFWEADDLARLGYDLTCCEGFHCHLNPVADGAWALKSIRKPEASILDDLRQDNDVNEERIAAAR